MRNRNNRKREELSKHISIIFEKYYIKITLFYDIFLTQSRCEQKVGRSRGWAHKAARTGSGNKLESLSFVFTLTHFLQQGFAP